MTQKQPIVKETKNFSCGHSHLFRFESIRVGWLYAFFTLQGTDWLFSNGGDLQLIVECVDRERRVMFCIVRKDVVMAMLCMLSL